ncbi:ABC transporter permease [Agathobaculum sp. NTUH-O15-33]|uniref:ABC transporter permease n=1 Tax=Agathobaculum sp. NTUH-O15-33 TaxID=3079302 RepID=UPI0029586E07|nr:ABC transporter permease [Agathobaculum sp. NTUH-O15-33]WNX86540.1 ABC transporter permease [Agathobaculum sp. NTUH-O15-33]
MRAADQMRLAASGLRQNPVRTLLCALSVAVGTGALMLIAALGLYGQAQVETSLRTLGVSGLTVYLDDHKGGNTISSGTADEIEKALPQVARAMAIKAKTGSVRAGHGNANAVFLGVDEKLGEVMQLELVAGSLLSERQAAFGENAVIIDDGLARSLYGRDNIVGRQVRLRIEGRDAYYTVQGVVKAQTGALGGTLSAFAPHLVYLPYACLATPEDTADQVFVKCTADAAPGTVSTQVERYLTDRKQVSGTVRVQNMTGMVDTVRSLTGLVTALFIAVGGITLCVALIGVTCSMLAAAHEKTEEIGVFLALGAQRGDILRIFLIQSVLLCLLGGLCGLGLAAGLLYFGASILPPGLPLCAALLLLSAGCGALAGLLPAVRAAQLSPVDAMRK